MTQEDLIIHNNRFGHIANQVPEKSLRNFQKAYLEQKNNGIAEERISQQNKIYLSYTMQLVTVSNNTKYVD